MASNSLTLPDKYGLQDSSLAGFYSELSGRIHNALSVDRDLQPQMPSEDHGECDQSTEQNQQPEEYVAGDVKSQSLQPCNELCVFQVVVPSLYSSENQTISSSWERCAKALPRIPNQFKNGASFCRPVSYRLKATVSGPILVARGCKPLSLEERLLKGCGAFRSSAESYCGGHSLVVFWCTSKDHQGKPCTNEKNFGRTEFQKVRLSYIERSR